MIAKDYAMMAPTFFNFFRPEPKKLGEKTNK